MRSDGTIELPVVTIPPNDVVNGMALVSVSPKHDNRSHFYIDCREFTVGEYANLRSGGLPQDLRWKSVPQDYPVTISYGEALAIAEKVGKRLPTETEFELALAYQKTHSLVSTPIFHLEDGVAEWTSTSAAAGGPDSRGLVPSAVTSDLRIARGGTMRTIWGESEPSTVDENDNLRRLALDRHLVAPGLGFRCVRTVKPRFEQRRSEEQR
jgi:formylglycine-generating enzyme required for sulfatase activity